MSNGQAVVSKHQPAHAISDALMFVVMNGKTWVEDDGQPHRSAGLPNGNFLSEEE